MEKHNEMILKGLNAALQGKKLYPPGHPSVVAAAKKSFQLLGGFLKEKDKLLVGIVDEALVFDELPVGDAENSYADLVEHLNDKKLEAIIIERGLTEKEFLAFLNLLYEEAESRGTELQKELRSMGVTHITFKSVTEGKRNIIEVYKDAVGVVKNVMEDIRLGKIPRSEEVNKIAGEMTDLVLSNTDAMIGLTMIKDYDNYLFNHSVNVSILSVALGKFMELDNKGLKALGVGSLLHDVGKTGVAENIIKKPGGLSSDEWAKVKEHPVLGSLITERMTGLEETVARIVYEHHIRFDHTGYPESESSLHPLSMIVSVVDAYDALTTLRAYQKPHHPVEAIKLLRSLAGKHFDPETVNAFEAMIGLYPVGTMVRLSTNEVGIVTKINHEFSDRPTVKVLYDRDVNEIHEPFEIDLTEKEDLSIVAPVDPLSKSVDLGAFFEEEASNI
jgi:HD-GYP domain-containing protein (c-di-GMP phosphodiesterase class II)